jgi:4-amino-4-deoxy-L-arabinose transferase-like glycosyltransferase
MDFISKYRLEILSGVLIALLFFFLRLSNLGSLPIFTDEAIYIRWAQIGLSDPNWRFISLSDGKQPLFVWGVMFLLGLFKDPLLAGRVVSVFGGATSVIAVWFVAYELFRKKRVAFLASFIYVCFPFAQVSDRMALYDSLSGAFTLWALYFSILLVKHLRLDLSYTLGITIGLGVLNKSTNFFSLYLLPFTLILFDLSRKGVWSRFAKWIFLALFAFILSIGMYSILRLSGLFHMVEQKNALFIFPFQEWVNHPFDFFIGNLRGMSNWTYEYLNLPFVLLILFAFRTKKFIREKLLLLLFFVLPFIALALFARIIFPRFIFFMTLSLVPLIAYGLDDLIDVLLERSKKILKGRTMKFLISSALVLAFVSYPLFVSYQFAFDPINSRIAVPDNAQYVNHWTAGWGVRESVKYLKEVSGGEEIFVATEGTFGLMPFALEIYLHQYKNIEIKGYWPLEKQLPQEVLDIAEKKKTYFIFYQPNNIDPPNPERLRLIMKTRAGNSIYFFRLYEVI